MPEGLSLWEWRGSREDQEGPGLLSVSLGDEGRTSGASS